MLYRQDSKPNRPRFFHADAKLPHEPLQTPTRIAPFRSLKATTESAANPPFNSLKEGLDPSRFLHPVRGRQTLMAKIALSVR